MHAQADTRSRLKCITLVALCFTVTASIHAANAAPPRKSHDIQQQFVNFGDQIIDGHIKRPVGTMNTSRKAATFGRMLIWKKRSFLPQLIHDGQILR
jgi:hypothetical protein